jgi:two-component system, OmpR family, phosphate regulon sensor histidine kinase PhoR
MKFQTTYKRKLFFYFLTVFVVFIAVIAFVQYNREKQYLDRELRARLNTYTEIIHSYVIHQGISGDFTQLDSIINILPAKDIRITVVAFNGTVLYDSFFRDFSRMNNHLSRPEIQAADMSVFDHAGTHIRLSESTRQPFYYYAKKYDRYYIRAAVLYSAGIADLLRVDNVFWYLIAILFLITGSVILYVSDTMGKSIVRLRDFANRAAENGNFNTEETFPENELGEIGNRIVNIYSKLHQTNQQLQSEKEKLLNHIQISKEGIAIYSANHQRIFANNNFMQYVSLLADPRDAVRILEIPELKPLRDFKENHLISDTSSKPLPVKRVPVNKNGRDFEVQCIIFSDHSYEIAISEVTQAVRQKKLKQEMTSNIAHELKTPVSSIKGYIDTILTGKDISAEKQRYFLEKASWQTDRLSDLLRDISVLTKIEESSELYHQENISLHKLVMEVIENLTYHIRSVNATVICKVNRKTLIRGNHMLIYSVFQNLIENSLKYGGEDITITIEEYSEEGSKVNILYADDGVGIDEEHHARIFERFYRIDKGRARESGGTGLGLAIVKNAIELHGNKIMVKSRKKGGVEFLFSLNKANSD